MSLPKKQGGETMADCNMKLEYKIKEITAKLDEQHDTILLTEIVEFCGQNDLLEYKVSVDTLKEALNFYFKHKNRPKGKRKIKYINNCYYYCCSICNNKSIEAGNYCPNCGADMREVEGSLWDKAIKADDIKKDDEWMQDDKWDEIYKEVEE